ncbi:DUF2463 domain-containing protein [Encephalitozoon hellem]|nr:DUF2463 domain-containing protein [Encephalitozoon hellem]
MNTIHTQHPHSSNLNTNSKPRHWALLLKQHAATISVIPPIIIYLLLREDTIHNVLLKLIIHTPPLLYSGTHYLIMSRNTKHPVSISTLHTALGSLLSIILPLLSTISLLTIVTLTLNDWEKDGIYIFSTSISPLLVLLPYTLSTSCVLTKSNFHYSATDTVHILLDLLILLFACHPRSIIISIVFVFIKSSTERCSLPAPHRHPKPWRLAVPAIILLIAISIHTFLGYALLATFREKLQALSLHN